MPRLSRSERLAFLGLLFLIGTILLAVNASASNTLPDGTVIDVYCVESDPCPEIGVDAYVLTGFKQTENPVVFGYWPGTVPCSQNGTTFPCPSPSGAPFGPQYAGIEQGIEEWGAAGANVMTVYELLATQPAGSACGGVFSGLDTLTQTRDGLNTVMWAPLGGTVIGLACWWTGTNECDVILDSTWPGFANEEATRTVLLHESGHCIGLSHSSDPSAVMKASYTSPQHLAPDDKAGLIAIYGAGAATPTKTPIPTATPTPTPGNCGQRLWPGVTPTCRFLPGIARD